MRTELLLRLSSIVEMFVSIDWNELSPRYFFILFNSSYKERNVFVVGA